MSATFVWTITALNCFKEEDGQSDVVYQVQWNCVGSQDVPAWGRPIAKQFVSETMVTLNPDAPFTPYDQLTQTQVWGWLVPQYVDQTAIEALLQSQIDEAINPPTVTPPLPWATQDATPAA
jgi:hypothetical protein